MKRLYRYINKEYHSKEVISSFSEYFDTTYHVYFLVFFVFLQNYFTHLTYTILYYSQKLQASKIGFRITAQCENRFPLTKNSRIVYIKKGFFIRIACKLQKLSKQLHLLKKLFKRIKQLYRIKGLWFPVYTKLDMKVRTLYYRTYVTIKNTY